MSADILPFPNATATKSLSAHDRLEALLAAGVPHEATAGTQNRARNATQVLERENFHGNEHQVYDLREISRGYARAGS